MKVSAFLFEAYLKCPTKCFLRSSGEAGTGNAYADWVRYQHESYRKSVARRLTDTVSATECAIGAPAETERKWRLAIDFTATGKHAESIIHAVERITSGARGSRARLVPTRFVFRNKLSRDDKLLIAFDAYALFEVTGHKASFGKIVHGDNYATIKVNIAALAVDLGKLVDKATLLVSGNSPPDLILNRHCVECEFQARCRQKAIEKDDLSLLPGMTEKERKKLNRKGIFTVTQLSFTFRPRRRPKRFRSKREKYHHALKALAIQQKKIHIVGNPQLKIEGTPVYLDVEALPDQDFYYLIGVRVVTSSVVERSFWADDADGERKMWRDFLNMLGKVENPVLIHYGSFETTFLKRMGECYGAPPEGSGTAKAIKSALNVVTFLFAQIYFPTYSNALKDIGGWLGCKWSRPISSGIQSIIWRTNWEDSDDPCIKQTLVTYNLEDCHALEVITETLLRICSPEQRQNLEGAAGPEVALADASPSRNRLWRRFSSPIADFEVINKAARWDYQRDRVYVRKDQSLQSATSRQTARNRRTVRINRHINCKDLHACPACGRSPDKVFRKRPRVLYDIRFTRFGLSRGVMRFRFHFYWCASCNTRFGMPEEFWPGSKKYGRNLVSLIVYEAIELCAPQQTVKQRLERLFDLRLSISMVYNLKANAAAYYAETRQRIFAKIIEGKLIHADETPIALKDRHGYVWVFVSIHEVAYFYTETREGDFLRERLKGFEGVLVSDFYAAYDSVPCAQQKCLLHLMRDLNEAVLDNPYDEDLKHMVTGFGVLLKDVVQTIDRWGLKRRFLNKHVAAVDRFYRQISKTHRHCEAALKWTERFEKNREKLFTFLTHDGIPWNNNNAEHAIKAFARLRRIISGLSSPKGIEDYLILLSICQTCKYSGLDFLDFLRSGEKTLDAFAKSRSRTRRAQQSSGLEFQSAARENEP